LLGVAAVAGLAGHLSETAHAENMTVNEYLCEIGNLNVSAAVTMNYSAGVLDVTVRNTTNTPGSGPDAGWVLTGLGFNLPNGMTIVDTSSMNSSIALPSGSSVVPSSTFSQDAWGYTTMSSGIVKKGHFKSIADDGFAVNAVNTTLSTLKEDVGDKTFGGSSANTVGLFDYALQSASAPAGPTPQGPYIEDSLNFKLYLSGAYDGDLLDYIQEHRIVAAFGSPTQSVVPEPSTLAALIGTALVGGILALRRRRR
jgi:hypothetical protein